VRIFSLSLLKICDLYSVAEPRHIDAAPDHGRQNDAAPNQNFFAWLVSCKILKLIHFDAVPALAPQHHSNIFRNVVYLTFLKFTFKVLIKFGFPMNSVIKNLMMSLFEKKKNVL
jgi:hypothetical protein